MSLLDPGPIPMKPAAMAEHRIIKAILEGSYLAGDALPGERALAQALGVTRPTLREILQRLAKEGWVTIAHGKPTRVNDYLHEGGLGILTTLARFGDDLSPEMIRHLLSARALMFPGVASQAAENDPKAVSRYLKVHPSNNAADFSQYDWALQMLMVHLAGNPVVRMIFNDFTAVYQVLGERYFSFKRARNASLAYYDNLQDTLDNGGDVQKVVASAMAEAQALWEVLL